MEGARQIGMPTLVRGRPYQDLLSAWIFAIALVLPAPYVVLAAAVLVPLLVRGVLRPVHRRAFNAAVVALSGLAAHQVADALLPGGRTLGAGILATGSGRLVGLAAGALLAYEVVNVGLVTVAIRLVDPGSPWREALGDLSTLVTDLTALCLGLLAAVAWAVEFALAFAAVPPAVLLQRALIHDELRAAAQTDAKTGLATAAYWLDLTNRFIERARRGSTGCAVLLIDVDHFKDVNDRWGHLVGDQVLAEVAQSLRDGVRPGDLVGRLGGEEFAVLLPDTSSAGAGTIGDRLRGSVGSHDVAVVGRGREGRVRVTISVGVASTAEVGYVVADLLASADAALYRAKAGGRDRVALGGPLDAGEQLWLSHLTAGLWRTTGVGS